MSSQQKFFKVNFCDRKQLGEQFASQHSLLVPVQLHYFQSQETFMNMEVCERNSCMHGYHIYKNVWHAVTEEELQCKRELDNESDRYAVAIKKDGTIIGHLPRAISRVCSLFLRRRNSISCHVAGHRRYSANLPQGGLEVPCTLRFEGKVKEVGKLKKFVKSVCFEGEVKEVAKLNKIMKPKLVARK